MWKPHSLRHDLHYIVLGKSAIGCTHWIAANEKETFFQHEKFQQKTLSTSGSEITIFLADPQVHPPLIKLVSSRPSYLNIHKNWLQAADDSSLEAASLVFLFCCFLDCQGLLLRLHLAHLGLNDFAEDCTLDGL